jgi:hypothetical protein
MLGMVVTLVIRLAAIRWHLKLPTFALDDNFKIGVVYKPGGASLTGPTIRIQA